MNRLLLASGLLAGFLVNPAFAVEPVEGARLGTEPGEIADALGASGYTMTRFKRETSHSALTAIKDGRATSIHVDAQTGLVIRADSQQTTDEAAILARLEADGYRIHRYEREGDRVEVQAEKDGRRWELKVDRRDGRILEIEAE